MAEKAILVYGLSTDEAGSVIQTLIEALGMDIDLFSATGHDEMTINDVVNDYPTQFYEKRENRFVMFLGVNDDELELMLKHYPKNHQRPIFCTLTEANRYWSVSTLAGHLAEEHKIVLSNKK